MIDRPFVLKPLPPPEKVRVQFIDATCASCRTYALINTSAGNICMRCRLIFAAHTRFFRKTHPRKE